MHPQELRGTEGMKVTMVNVPSEPYLAIALGQSASFRPWKRDFAKEELVNVVKDLSSGKWSGQCFEAVNFTFLIENISRVTTHQLVRTRIGTGFMQESGRDGTWDCANFVTPLTILEDAHSHSEFVEMMNLQLELYRAFKNRGLPAQDARFEMGHAIAQNMWMTINLTALIGWCGNRLCTTMQWEINTLARMIRDEVFRIFPHLGSLLKSRCEKRGGCFSVSDGWHHSPTNGNKVYWQSEGALCGQAGVYTEDEKIELLRMEMNNIQNVK